MREDGLFDHLLLGRGGPGPGMTAVGMDGAAVRTVMDTPVGHSVYAIDVDAVNGLIAAGTRAGSVELLSSRQVPGRFERCVLQGCAQGASVLSVCIIDTSYLASADIAARFLLWRLQEQPDKPVALETRGEQVCSAAWIPSERLVGLTANGKLLFWSVPDFQLLDVVEGPRPSPKLALIRLCHWLNHNSLVYPAQNGQLVACELDGLRLTVAAAHEGAFYVCIPDGDQLHTIGHADGVMRAWDGVDDSSRECRVPRGIIAGAALDGGPAKFLLVGHNGEAGTYAVESGSLNRVGSLDGNHYRTISGPSLQARQEHARRQLTSRCEQLRSHCLEELNAGRMDDLEDSHQELVELGAESVSLTLRVQQAVQQQDLISELKARRRLAVLMPDQPKSSFIRFARVLETTWQLAEAARVRATLVSDDITLDPTGWLEKATAILAGADWVVQTETPMRLLVEAATVLERPFVGHWAVATSEPVPFPDGDLTAQSVAAKYAQVLAEHGLDDLPNARVRRTWWISDDGIERTDIIVFTDAPGRNGPRLCPAIQLVSDGLRDAFIPWTLFDAGVTPTCAYSNHNFNVLRAYQASTRRGPQPVWPSRLHWAVCSALRRLQNQVRSRKFSHEVRNA